MPEPQLSVRGADVIALAHRLSEEEGRSIRAVVTDALREYAERKRRAAGKRADDYWAPIRAEMEAGRRLALTRGRPDEGEDDLYDEDGLPG